MIVAIDGPAGAGKSTTARAVAAHFGWAYIDTGAMYRAIALAASECASEDRVLDLRENVAAHENELAQMAQSLPLRFEENGTRIFIGERDISGEIRTPQIGDLTSQISALPRVREQMVALQRRIARQSEEQFGGAVLEGRDIQTVVFPDAPVKIFLTANSNTRSARRLDQWNENASTNTKTNDVANESAAQNAVSKTVAAKNNSAQSVSAQSVSADDARRDIEQRDERDSHREVSPLCAAPDAVTISTDFLSPTEVVAQIAQLIQQKMV